jgi:hypothetical protein
MARLAAIPALVVARHLDNLLFADEELLELSCEPQTCSKILVNEQANTLHDHGKLALVWILGLILAVLHSLDQLTVAHDFIGLENRGGFAVPKHLVPCP